MTDPLDTAKEHTRDATKKRDIWDGLVRQTMADVDDETLRAIIGDAAALSDRYGGFETPGGRAAWILVFACHDTLTMRENLLDDVRVQMDANGHEANLWNWDVLDHVPDEGWTATCHCGWAFGGDGVTRTETEARTAAERHVDANDGAWGTLGNG